MPGNTAIVRGNLTLFQVVKSNTVAPAAFSTTTSSVTVSINGVKVGDMVEVFLPSIVTGVYVGTVVAANNSITIQFVNSTGGSVTPPAASATAPYLFRISREENPYPRGIPFSLV